MDTLEQRFFSHLKQRNLLFPGERILVALSGGKDSVCLLLLLKSVAAYFGIELFAMHVHHMLRKDAADRDLEFCRELCLSEQIPFSFAKCDVPAFCRENGVGTEEGARILRYRALRKEKERLGAHCIAVAHTASDQAETVLFRIMRGAGMTGLGAMKEKSEDLIRPLLPFFSYEIEAYLQNNHRLFTQDTSNADILYKRNYIRQKLLPEMEREMPGTEKHLAKLSEVFSFWIAMAENEAEKAEKNLKNSFENNEIPLDFLKKTLKNEEKIPVLFMIFKKMTAKSGVAISTERFFALLDLLKNGESGKIVEIGKGYEFCLQSERLVFRKKPEFRVNSVDFQTRLSPGSTPVPILGAKVILGAKKNGKVVNNRKKDLIIHAAFDKIDGCLSIRNCRAGDKIIVDGTHRSVRKILSEMKISPEFRDKFPVITDASGIVWLPFFGLCDRVRHSENGSYITLSISGAFFDELQNIINSKDQRQ